MKTKKLKIIIIQTGLIGDTVLTTPVFKAIATYLPHAQIYVLASPHGAAVLQDNPQLTKVFVYRKKPWVILQLIFQLRLHHFDWWIDPKDHYSTTGSFLVRICGAKKSIGFNRGTYSLFTFGIPSFEENFLLHMVIRNLQVLKILKIDIPVDFRPELFPDPDLKKEIGWKLTFWNELIVLLNISAGSESRYWDIEKWSDVAAACLHKGCRVLLIFKPSDEGYAQILYNLQSDLQLFPTKSIQEIIALMPHVQLVITADTSIVHIASAFNIPQIALFQDIAWNRNAFRPLSNLHFVIQPKNGAPLKSIRSEEVIEAFNEVMAAITTKTC